MGFTKSLQNQKRVLQDSQTISFHLSCSAYHLCIITNAGYTGHVSVTLWEEVSLSPPADREVAGPRPCSKVAQNLCIVKIPGKL